MAEQHQIDEWGEVEAGHDLDKADLQVIIYIYIYIYIHVYMHICIYIIVLRTHKRVALARKRTA